MIGTFLHSYVAGSGWVRSTGVEMARRLKSMTKDELGDAMRIFREKVIQNLKQS